MSKPVTLDDIFQLFERQKEETERRAAEWERTFAASTAESDRRIAEIKTDTERIRTETEQIKTESDRRIAEIKTESDRRIAEIKTDTERIKTEIEGIKTDTERIRTESDRRIAEIKTESDRRIAEIKADTERIRTETEQIKTESDRRIAEIKTDTERIRTETERRAAETKVEADCSLDELRRLVNATTEAVNNLTGRWGRFVEELVKPAVVEMFRAKGIEIDHSFLRAEAPDKSMEIDILGVNTTDVVLVECKSRLTQEDVDYFLGKLPRFKTAFREFAAYNIYGAVAGIEIDQGVDRYAYKKGLFVIKPSGNTVAIVNDYKFLPQTW